MFRDVPAWRLSDAAAFEAMQSVSRALVARLAEPGTLDEIRAVRAATAAVDAADRTTVLTRATDCHEQILAAR